MEPERANWCRFAQLIIKIGGKVLRRFFLLESLTSVFTKYYCHWKSEVYNPRWIAQSYKLWDHLNSTPRHSTQSAVDDQDKLLTSWKNRGLKCSTLMEEINRLQEWLNDIEKMSLCKASEGVNDTLETWSSQIKKRIEQLNSMNTVLRQWDADFLDTLFGAQVRLQGEIENHDLLISSRIQELKQLISNPSSHDLQQVINKCKRDVDTLKMNCTGIFQTFEDACCTLLAKWEKDETGCIEDTIDCETLVKFLRGVRKEISKTENAASLSDCLYNRRYNLLSILSTIKEEGIMSCNLASGISKLAKKLCEQIESSPSFRETLFKESIEKLHSSPERSKLSKQQRSKLKDISSSTGLEAVDNSLLVAMLQKSDFVHSRLYSEDEDLPDWETSISADILRLRSHRDNIIAHATQAKISNDMFVTLWDQAAALCCRIAARCGSDFETTIKKEIDYMKFVPLEAGREFRLWQEIVEWCKQDILVQLSTTSPESSMLLEMLNNIEMVRADVTIIKQDPSIWQCCNCKTEFTRGQDFDQHKCVQESQWYQCAKCKKKAAVENDLFLHTCTQAPTFYVCRNCEQEFNANSFPLHRCTRVSRTN
ncbi:hypothetical protein CHS0354_000056 [Potamilus streckersoni]|uniref:DZIP3-like HEPN domain-containing protein n=1 Tax=Potamilus streckersoni TaxID=2493646 RepID=A0AAE0W1W8_9BIVA|nr:hypothetical protein CHS0354_000056 [Potamilus streckersoni]